MNWESRSLYWGWANVYDCPLRAWEGVSIDSPKEVRDKWREICDDHYVADKWEDGDTVIYNPDWTVKEIIKRNRSIE